ncbi:unnamed protein product [Onchocerca ochengi]|uniref:DUF4169 family protein n=1 Tax=Onchocerca ochengi TaxID=42157 RepID=A0A182EBX5_ONCOC|nr:unnamed protein product [Onchocerca ochengi]
MFLAKTLRRSNLDRAHAAEQKQRLIANQTEEERALANKRRILRMAQVRAEKAERRAARLQDALSHSK